MSPEPNYYPDQFRKLTNRNPLLCSDINLIPRILCAICLQIMIEPAQTSCGCRFCHSCITSYHSKERRGCPNCQDSDVTLIRDKAIEREILNQSMKCLNKGCTEIFTIRELRDHLTLCNYRSMICDKCEEVLCMVEKEEHLANYCRRAIVKCSDCGKDMTREELVTKHRAYESGLEGLCEGLVSECPYKCGDEAPVNLSMHLGTCVNRPCQCPMADIGCSELVSQISLDRHCQENLVSHHLMLVSEIVRLRSENEDLRRQHHNDENSLRLRLCELEEENNRQLTEISRLTTVADRLRSDLSGLSPGSVPGRGDVQGDPHSMTWTIEDVRAKIRSAMVGGVNQVVSEPAYLGGPRGYRMAIKAYLAGDGLGRGDYLSVFFVLCQGEWDEGLEWPFRRRVTLRLLGVRRDDVVVRMIPDDNAACYGRPMTGRNVAAGQPRFLRLTDVLDKDWYVDNGALRLRLTVDAA